MPLAFGAGRTQGLMNVQFAVKDGEVYLIEVNPRASRTVPFVAKAIGQPDGQDRKPGDGRREKLTEFPPIHSAILPYMAVKGSGVPVRTGSRALDPVLTPEMKSTGEVMGIDAELSDSVPGKSQLGAGKWSSSG